MYVCMCMYAYMYVRIYVSVCMHACMYVCIGMYVRMYVCVYVQGSATNLKHCKSVYCLKCTNRSD